MQDIYSHIAETSHVPTVFNVAAILLLQYIAHVMLLPTIHFLHSTTVLTRSMCAAPNVAVFWVSGHRAFPLLSSGTL